MEFQEAKKVFLNALNELENNNLSSQKDYQSMYKSIYDLMGIYDCFFLNDSLENLKNLKNQISRKISTLKKAPEQPECCACGYNDCQCSFYEKQEIMSYLKDGYVEVYCDRCNAKQWMLINKPEGVCCECGESFDNEQYQEPKQ